jgi:hypothetical protein
MNRKIVVASMAIAASLYLMPDSASAALLGFEGTGGFIVDGPGIGALPACFPVACDSGFVAFNTGALLADGMNVSGLVRETVLGDGAGGTASALLRVTNIVATNTNIGGGLISDTLFLVSDVFNPSVAGTAGVGIFGSFQSTAGVGGNISWAQTQAQMNYLTTPVGAFGGPIVSFSLTTVSPFVTCVACSPIGFGAFAFANPVAGGIVQLVGAINFTVGAGSQVVLPGSLLLEDNDEASILSETPEPATFLLFGTAMAGLGAARRYRRA